MTTVVVVDDSASARLALRHALELDVSIRVVADASNATRAELAIREHRPDIVTMDVHLGSEDGIECAGRIMNACPTPILIVTGLDPKDPDLVFRAMQAGALEVFPKLPGPSSPAYSEGRTRLVRTVKALARVPVVTRHRRSAPATRAASTPPAPGSRRSTAIENGSPRLVAIGASTGGPPVLHSLLSSLPAPFPVPIAIVQHICAGFTQGLATWLSTTTGHDVRVCENCDRLEPGRVYLGADARHLRVLSDAHLGPAGGAPRHLYRPAIDELFESAAQKLGPSVVAVLLTGMGSDGADGLRALREAGALTLAQSFETCVVDSMPRHAHSAGAVAHLLHPDEIGAMLRRIATRSEDEHSQDIGRTR